MPMKQMTDTDLIDRVMQAMQEAARLNGPDSPHTNLEAMAQAAIKVVRNHG